ncbi:hypothetical protein DEI96_000565 [Curtobacterium sp. MCLR17_031]|uniref:copper amine oxidase n=1 Tax=Curtobacterium sp. MCLR17_031 TaxID=2175622 RepID=UPI000DAA860F|nr:hypothetical protein [Curtobacterium sp. MCLR17_031]WIE58137.1 hypothetical protein DEI96_000565 [Curtobacterium sp. MCLR17_031]
MMTHRPARLAVSWGALVCAFTIGLAVAGTPVAPAAIKTATPAPVSTTPLRKCTASQGSISASLTGGTTWQLCWDINLSTGLEVTDASYTPAGASPLTVIRKAALAQIDVPYDNGTKEHLDLPAFGTLTTASDIRPSDCPDGKLVAATADQPALLCEAIVSDGAAYEWDDYDFGLTTHRAASQCLEIYTVTPADWYTYMNTWDFCGDGRVVGKVGASGTLAPSPNGYGDAHDGQPIGSGNTRYALNHYHNVFWRLQFGLDDGGPASIATVGSTGGAHRVTTATPIRSETAMQSAPDRMWMVTDPGRRNADHHAVGYDIELHNDSPYRGVPNHAYTDNDFYVTQNRACEVLAAGNSAARNCSTSVDRFVSGDKLSSPVIWMQTSFHHLPRDEDESVVDEHWQGFTLMPRDVTATNPLGTGLPQN